MVNINIKQTKIILKPVTLGIDCPRNYSHPWHFGDGRTCIGSTSEVVPLSSQLCEVKYDELRKPLSSLEPTLLANLRTAM